MLEDINSAELEIPGHVSLKARMLIKRLLSRDPAKRLGASIYDAEEIKSNVFFSGVDWKQVYLKAVKPPEVATLKPQSSYTIEDEENHSDLSNWLI